jgi:hypothetical protein
MKEKRKRVSRLELILGAWFAMGLLGCEPVEAPPKIGEQEQAVVNGAKASRGEYPWQVLLIHDNARMCGGSLISNEWVLTAAHCLDGRSAKDFVVVLGRWRLLQNDSAQQVRSISDYVIHPAFSRFGDDNLRDYHDVALVKLSSPVSFTRYVKPIKLATGNDAAGLQAWVTGWGRIEGGNSQSRADYLQEAMLPVRANADCDAVPDPILQRDLLETELCVGYLQGDRGACHGDSGGPLAVRRPGGAWELIGVVNWGQENYCGSYSVFARVSSYASWINSVMNEQAAPRADFAVSASGLTVDFRDQSSDADGYIAGWQWDFNDNQATSNRQHPTHTFSAAGTYEVRLTVTDDKGAVDTIAKSIRVEQITEKERYFGVLADGERQQQPNGSYYQAAAGNHVGRLAGPAGTNFDLYLYKWSSSSQSWTRVASSTTSGSVESVEYSGASGYYTWLVASIRGSGSYDLQLTRP